MLLQTNSYIVPKEKRAEHARLLRRFRQTLARLGCEHFEAYEQVGQGWASGEPTGRFVQLMRFRDRAHQQSVQAAERSDPAAQALIREFCELINFPYQQEHGLFAVGFYSNIFAPPAGGTEGDAAAAEQGSQVLPQPQPQPAPQQDSVEAQADVVAEAEAAAAGDAADGAEQLADAMIQADETPQDADQTDAEQPDDRAAADQAYRS